MPRSARNIPGYPGYQVDQAGRVFTEWQRRGLGKGQGFAWYRSGHFRPLKVQSGLCGRLYVRLRRREGVYDKRSPSTLIRLAFAPES